MPTKFLAINDLRYKRAALTSLLNVLAQAIQIATAFISVPLTLNHVGPEQFGLWITLTTALTFVTFADFGIGIGAQNRISQAIAEGNQSLAASYFYTAIAFSLLVVILILIFGEFLIQQINISSLFSLKTHEASRTAGAATQLVVATLALGIPAGIIQRTYQALQEGFIVAIIQIIGRIISLGLLFIVIELDFGLTWIIFSINSLPILFLLIVGYVYLTRRYEWLSRGWEPKPEISFKIFKSISQLGLVGLGAVVSVYLINNLPPFIMSFKYGADQIVDYAAVLRLISAPTLIFSYLLLPLWPALTEAHSRQEKTWIHTTYSRCVYVTLLCSVLSAGGLIIFGKDFIYYWTRNSLAVPSSELLYACTALLVAGYWNTLVSVLLNGLSRFKGQATYGLALAATFSVMAFLLPPHFGKETIIWTVAIGYLLRCGIMHYELHRALFSSKSG